jgi:hypothetical protein
MTSLGPDDDRLHPPASADRWWSETCWFSFDQPGEDVSATIYPLFRPNLGVCSLGVYVWDASAHEPWRVLYGRSFWHLAMPATDLTELRLEGLEYDCLEPLRRYRVAYRDEDLLDLELEYTGLREPHATLFGRGVGHLDQPCHVVGEVTVRGHRIAVDTVAMRDRTWSVRPEDRRSPGTAYTYGTADADDQFLVMTTLDGNEGTFVRGVFSGYLVRGGVTAALVSARRQVVERRDGHPVRIELSARDELGRSLHAVGVTRNRLANQASPSQFAWMSMTAWEDADGRAFVGEDQEVWSPDRLGPLLRGLDT